MLHSKKKNIAIVDFKPAKLALGKDWLIVYYAKHPQSGKLQRFRHRVPPMNNQKQRTIYANKMVQILNEKLLSGWSPFLENTHELKTFNHCLDIFFKTIKKEVQDRVKRPNTLNDYQTKLRKFSSYLAQKSPVKFIVEITPKIIHQYLDFLYLEQKCRSATFNAHVKQLKSFFNFCVSKDYIKETPLKHVKLKPTSEKIRVVLNDKEKADLQRLKFENHGFYITCMLTYYCFIRPAELLKLKVSDVYLDRGFITISAEISKNKKTENVTIPNVFVPDLQQYIKNAPADFFLIGKHFKPSKTPQKQLNTMWGEIREKYNFRKEVQFYSLKDTGITDLLNMGIPAIKVRDQARHHDLKITEAYTARNKFADETLRQIKSPMK